MNKLFKVVWSKSKNNYVVVSEIAKRNGKCSSSLNKKLIAAFLAAGTVMSVTGSAWAADVVYTNESLPTGNYDHPEDVVTITQNSDCTSDVSSPIYVTQDTTINTKELIIDSSQRTSNDSNYERRAIFINLAPLTLSSDKLVIDSYGHGIYCEGPGDAGNVDIKMTIADKLTISSQTASGVHVKGSNANITIDNENGENVITGSQYGIYNAGAVSVGPLNNSTVQLIGARNVIKVVGNTSNLAAIEAGNDGSVSVTSTTGNLTSEVDGSARTSLYSLFAHDNGSVSLKSEKGDVIIKTNQTAKKGTVAVNVVNGFGKIDISAKGNVEIEAVSSSKDANGIEAQGKEGSAVNIDAGKDIIISARGKSYDEAINVHKSAVTLTANGDVRVYAASSDHGYGLMSTSTNTDTVKVDSRLKIQSKNNEVKVDGSSAYAIWCYGERSSVQLAAEENNTLVAKSGFGIIAGHQIEAAKKGKVVVTGINNTITANIGVYGYGKAEISLTAKDGGNNEIKDSNTPIISQDESEVSLDATGKNIIKSIGTTAINARTDGKVSLASGIATEITGNVNAATNGSVTVESPSTLLEGDITAATGGKVEMNSFTDSDSKMTGKVTTDEESSTELTFSDGATWNMTESSNVSNLVFKNAVIDMTTTEGNKSLTIDKSFTGDSGTFKMNLKYGSGSDHPLYKAEDVTDSDYIFALNSSSGTYDIQYDTGKANLDAMDKGDKLYFSYVEGNSAQYTSSSTEKYKRDDPSEVYVYKYAVENESSDNGKTGKNWYITLTKDEPEPEPGPEPQPKPKPQPKPQPKPSSAVEIISDMGYSNYALGADLDRLNKRMGEARYIDETHGAWVRLKRGRQGIDNAFKNNYTMVQIGMDGKVKPHHDLGKHYQGFALDYTDANTGLTQFSGHGDVKRYAVEGYDTWLGHNGHYRDIVARFGRIESDYSALGRTGKEVSAEYHNNFGSLNIEYGRKKDMGNEWYFEPQAQLQVARVGSASYTTKQGLWNRQDAITSVIARGGFRIGRDMVTDKDQLRRSYYFKADIMHEFNGDRSMIARSADGLDTLCTDYDGKRTWADIGLGVDMEMNKNSYFFMDVERDFGSGISRTWQINGGFRWEWK